MSVVPDAIEPVVGWKALRMRPPFLLSPSFEQEWPHRAPLVSECRAPGPPRTQFSWKAIPSPEGWDEELFWVPSCFLAEGRSTFFPWPSDPAPPGMTYVPVELPHDMAGCKCGIYVVTDAKDCRAYLQGLDRVLVQIAVWGSVVPGSQGCRGSLAYPQLIVAGYQQSEMAIPVAEAYGVPLELIA